MWYSSVMSRAFLFDALQIVSPCEVAQDRLKPNALGLYCASCNQTVYDFSSLSRAEAEMLVRERRSGRPVCAQLTLRRSDGAIRLADGYVTRGSLKESRPVAMVLATTYAAVASACSTAPSMPAAATPAVITIPAEGNKPVGEVQHGEEGENRTPALPEAPRINLTPRRVVKVAPPLEPEYGLGILHETRRGGLY